VIAVETAGGARKAGVMEAPSEFDTALDRYLAHLLVERGLPPRSNRTRGICASISTGSPGRE